MMTGGNAGTIGQPAGSTNNPFGGTSGGGTQPSGAARGGIGIGFERKLSDRSYDSPLPLLRIPARPRRNLKIQSFQTDHNKARFESGPSQYAN